MKTRLFTLFWVDRESRMKMYAASFALSTIIGVGGLLSGKSGLESTPEAIVAALLIVGAWTLIYCTISSPQGVRSDGPIGRRMALASTFVTVAVLCGMSAGKIEAAVINRKLLSFTRRSEIYESDIDAVTNTLSYVKQGNLKIDTAALSAVGKKLSEVRKANTSGTLAASAHKALELVAGTQSTVRVAAEPQGRPTRKASGVPHVGIHRHGVFHGVTVELDNRAFIDSLVEECTVIYRGGPVLLKNTGFEKCTFDIDSSTPQGRALLLLFAESNDPTFSYLSEKIDPDLGKNRRH